MLTSFLIILLFSVTTHLLGGGFILAYSVTHHGRLASSRDDLLLWLRSCVLIRQWTRRQKELSAMPSCLSPFPHFIQYRTIAYGVVPPLFRVDLPLY